MGVPLGADYNLPADLFAILATTGLDEKALAGLPDALEAPLDRMMEGS